MKKVFPFFLYAAMWLAWASWTLFLAPQLLLGAVPLSLVDSVAVKAFEKGKYHGYLILTNDEGFYERKKCRIKVLDKELRERENK